MLSNVKRDGDLEHLHEVIVFQADRWKFRTYDEFIQDGNRTSIGHIYSRMRSATSNDVCNLQFTSGTTGSPKAAMLTHQ
jgi:long-subunit acyl-CoA synthetase (AMP-forming)